MLDDLKYIHEKDAQDALGLVSKQWQQLRHEFDIPAVEGEILNIVHSGMGGSALWAFLAASWPAFRVPFEIVRGYDIPPYVGDKTLFVASSYSGNTEETVSALAQAEARGARIVVITSGGALADTAREKGHALIMLPMIDKPRYGAFYGLVGLVALTERMGLTARPDALVALRGAADFLQPAIAGWAADVPAARNDAKRLALELAGTSPVIYGGPLLAPAAHKWKIGFNENAKNIAWEYVFPEFNHNEFTGWTSHPVDKPYGIVFLRSSFDHERVKRRFALSDKLLSGKWPPPHIVEAQGSTPIEQMLWTVTMGDFVSIYLALLNGTSPIDVGDKDIIERFKRELG